MISTLERLVLRETLTAFSVIVIVLLLLILANTFVRLLAEVATGGISHELMMMLIGLNTVKLLAFVMPPAYFFSILWVVGRMYRNSEMTALNAAGISVFKLYRPLVIAAFPIALLVGMLALWILPLVKGEADQLKQELVSNIQLSGIRAGTFNEFQKGKLVVFAAESSPETSQLQQVFVQHQQHGEQGIVVAEKAQMRTDPASGESYIVLEDGYRYQGIEGKTEYSITAFGEYGVRMPHKSGAKGRTSLSARSSKALWHSDSSRDQAELQYRIGLPLSVFVLMLVGVPLAKSTPREGTYGRLIVAVVIYAIYMNLQKAAQEWMAEGLTASWLGTWWLPLTFLLLAAVFGYLNTIDFAIRKQGLFRRTA